MISLGKDLFGEPLPAADAPKKQSQRRKVGYAARPGGGPRKQRCATCAHLVRVLHKGVYSSKCQLMAHAWTHGDETDIKPNAPACQKWDRKPFTVKQGPS